MALSDNCKLDEKILFEIVASIFEMAEAVGRLGERAKHKKLAAKVVYNARALAMGAEGTHTEQDVLDICVLQGGRCVYCGAPFDSEGNPYQEEHLVALSKGGSDWVENLALTCWLCNLWKNAKSMDEFLKSRGPDLNPNYLYLFSASLRAWMKGRGTEGQARMLFARLISAGG